MEKQKFDKKRLKLLIAAAAVGVFIFNVWFGLVLKNRADIQKQTVRPSQVQEAKERFYYKGETGKDALSLLKEKNTVLQDKSGLVVSINGRKTDIKKEFWAFFVNGKFAEVGPAEYQTKDSDLIEWKIEKVK